MHTHYSFLHGVTATAVLMTLLLLQSCSSIDSRTAALLSDEAFRKGVVDYVPLRTLRDSVFDTAIDNFQIRTAAREGWDALIRQEKMLSNAKENISLAQMWSDDGEKEKAAGAYKDAERYVNLAARAQEELDDAESRIHEMAESVTGKLIGWRVTHEYYCTVDGCTVKRRMVLITDAEARNVIENYDSGNEDRYEADAFIIDTLGL